MANQLIKEKSSPVQLQDDERILVVKRSDLMPNEPWHGIKRVDFDEYLDIIDKKKQFLWRSRVEHDPTYKQIIPYLILKPVFP